MNNNDLIIVSTGDVDEGMVVVCNESGQEVHSDGLVSPTSHISIVYEPIESETGLGYHIHPKEEPVSSEKPSRRVSLAEYKKRRRTNDEEDIKKENIDAELQHRSLDNQSSHRCISHDHQSSHVTSVSQPTNTARQLSTSPSTSGTSNVPSLRTLAYEACHKELKKSSSPKGKESVSSTSVNKVNTGPAVITTESSVTSTNQAGPKMVATKTHTIVKQGSSVSMFLPTPSPPPTAVVNDYHLPVYPPPVVGAVPPPTLHPHPSAMLPPPQPHLPHHHHLYQNPYQTEILPGPPAYSPYPRHPPPHPQWGGPPHLRRPLPPNEFHEISSILQAGELFQKSLAFRHSTRSRSYSRSRSPSRSRSHSRSHSRSPSRSPRRSHSKHYSRSSSPIKSPLQPNKKNQSIQAVPEMIKRGVQCQPKLNNSSSQTYPRLRNRSIQTVTKETVNSVVQTNFITPTRSAHTQTVNKVTHVKVQTEDMEHPSLLNLLSVVTEEEWPMMEAVVKNMASWLERKLNAHVGIFEEIEDEGMITDSPLSGCSNISEGNWSDFQSLGSQTTPSPNNIVNNAPHQKKEVTGASGYDQTTSPSNEYLSDPVTPSNVSNSDSTDQTSPTDQTTPISNEYLIGIDPITPTSNEYLGSTDQTTPTPNNYLSGLDPVTPTQNEYSGSTDQTTPTPNENLCISNPVVSSANETTYIDNDHSIEPTISPNTTSLIIEEVTPDTNKATPTCTNNDMYPHHLVEPISIDEGVTMVTSESPIPDTGSSSEAKDIIPNTEDTLYGPSLPPDYSVPLDSTPLPDSTSQSIKRPHSLPTINDKIQSNTKTHSTSDDSVDESSSKRSKKDHQPLVKSFILPSPPTSQSSSPEEEQRSHSLPPLMLSSSCPLPPTRRSISSSPIAVPRRLSSRYGLTVLSTKKYQLTAAEILAKVRAKKISQDKNVKLMQQMLHQVPITTPHVTVATTPSSMSNEEAVAATYPVAIATHQSIPLMDHMIQDTSSITRPEFQCYPETACTTEKLSNHNNNSSISIDLQKLRERAQLHIMTQRIRKQSTSSTSSSDTSEIMGDLNEFMTIPTLPEEPPLPPEDPFPAPPGEPPLPPEDPPPIPPGEPPLPPEDPPPAPPGEPPLSLKDPPPAPLGQPLLSHLSPSLEEPREPSSSLELLGMFLLPPEDPLALSREPYGDVFPSEVKSRSHTSETETQSKDNRVLTNNCSSRADSNVKLSHITETISLTVQTDSHVSPDYEPEIIIDNINKIQAIVTNSTINNNSHLENSQCEHISPIPPAKVLNLISYIQTAGDKNNMTSLKDDSSKTAAKPFNSVNHRTAGDPQSTEEPPADSLLPLTEPSLDSCINNSVELTSLLKSPEVCTDVSLEQKPAVTTSNNHFCEHGSPSSAPVLMKKVENHDDTLHFEATPIPSIMVSEVISYNEIADNNFPHSPGMYCNSPIIADISSPIMESDSDSHHDDSSSLSEKSGARTGLQLCLSTSSHSESDDIEALENSTLLATPTNSYFTETDYLTPAAQDNVSLECLETFAHFSPTTDVPLLSCDDHMTKAKRMRLEFPHVESQDMVKAAVTIQTRVRGFLCYKRYHCLRNATIKIQSNWRVWSIQRSYKSKKQSIILLQSYFRMYQARRRYINMTNSTIILQQYCRGYLARKRYQNLHSSVLLLQRWIRGVIVRRWYQRLRVGVVKFQSHYRGYKARQLYHKQIMGIIKFQALYRGYMIRKSYVTLKMGVVQLQALYRSYRIRQSYWSLKRGVVKYQALYRGYKTRQWYCHLKRGVVKCQSHCRAQKIRKNHQLLKVGVVKCQALYRGYKERQQYWHLKVGVVKAQSLFRGYRCRQWYKKLRLVVIKMQSIYRGHRTKEKYLRLKVGVVRFQSCYRGYKIRQKYKPLRKSVVKCQALHCGYKLREDYQQLEVGVVKVQSLYRGYKMREWYNQVKKSVLKIQTLYRGYRMRRSYYDLRTAVIKCQALFRGHIARKNIHKQHVAAVCIQSSVRCYFKRRQYLELKQATVMIQRAYRSYQVRCMIKERGLAGIQIQPCYHGYSYRNTLKQKIHSANVTQAVYHDNDMRMNQEAAATLIQSMYKGYVSRTKFVLLKKAAILVQATYRRHVCRSRFVRLKKAAVFIQQTYRSLNKVRGIQQTSAKKRKTRTRRQVQQTRRYSTRLNSRKLLQAAIAIQQVFRAKRQGKRDRQTYLNTRQAAIAIQQLFRAKFQGKRDRQTYLNTRQAAITIQQLFRAKCQGKRDRQTYLNTRQAAITIQQLFRAKRQGKRDRQTYLNTRQAAITIQQLFRAKCQGKRDRQTYLNTRQAAITIQQLFRAKCQGKRNRQTYLNTRQAAITIQQLFRAKRQGKGDRQTYLNTRQAAITIQQLFRAKCQGKRDRQTYLNTRQAAITIQKRWRSRKLDDTHHMETHAVTTYHVEACPDNLQVAIYADNNQKGTCVETTQVDTCTDNIQVKTYIDILQEEKVEETRAESIWLETCSNSKTDYTWEQSLPKLSEESNVSIVTPFPFHFSPVSSPMQQGCASFSLVPMTPPPLPATPPPLPASPPLPLPLPVSSPLPPPLPPPLPASPPPSYLPVSPPPLPPISPPPQSVAPLPQPTSIFFSQPIVPPISYSFPLLLHQSTSTPHPVTSPISQPLYIPPPIPQSVSTPPPIPQPLSTPPPIPQPMSTPPPIPQPMSTPPPIPQPMSTPPPIPQSMSTPPPIPQSMSTPPPIPQPISTPPPIPQSMSTPPPIPQSIPTPPQSMYFPSTLAYTPTSPASVLPMSTSSNPCLPLPASVCLALPGSSSLPVPVPPPFPPPVTFSQSSLGTNDSTRSPNILSSSSDQSNSPQMSESNRAFLQRQTLINRPPNPSTPPGPLPQFLPQNNTTTNPRFIERVHNDYYRYGPAPGPQRYHYPTSRPPPSLPRFHYPGSHHMFSNFPRGMRDYPVPRRLHYDPVHSDGVHSNPPRSYTNLDGSGVPNFNEFIHHLQNNTTLRYNPHFGRPPLRMRPTRPPWY